MEITQEILDAYVWGDLDQRSQSQLNPHLLEDADLKEELALHRLVMEGIEAYGKSDFLSTINEVEETLDQNGFFGDLSEQEVVKGIEDTGKMQFLEMLNDVEKQLEGDSFFKSNVSEPNESNVNGKETKVVKMMPMRRLLSLAASLLLLVTAGLWYFNDSTPSNEELYDIHFANLPDEISRAVEAEMNEIGFGEGEDKNLELLKRAMTSYNEKDYLAFLKSTEEILGDPELSHYQNQLGLYRAIALMERENYKNALKTLKALKDQNDEVRWYMGMVYLKMNNVTEAKSIFANLKNSVYAEKALKIMSLLE